MDQKKIKEGILLFPVSGNSFNNNNSNLNSQSGRYSFLYHKFLKPLSKTWIENKDKDKKHWCRKDFCLYGKSSQGIPRLEEKSPLSISLQQSQSSTSLSHAFIFRPNALKNSSSSSSLSLSSSSKTSVIKSRNKNKSPGKNQDSNNHLNNMSNHKKIVIPLNDCMKIWSPSFPLIEILTRGGEVFTLKVEGGRDEVTAWLLSLQQVAFGFMHEEEENQLYASFAEDGKEDESTASVKVIASPVQSLLDWPTNFLLKLTPEVIQLLYDDQETQTPIFIWNLRDIRRYGSSPETFTFEAGRRCASGPGIFSFATNKGTHVFNLLSKNLRDLVQQDLQQQQDSEKQSGIKVIRNESNESKQPKKPPRRSRENIDSLMLNHSSLTPSPTPIERSSRSASCGSNSSDSYDVSPDYENILTLNILRERSSMNNSSQMNSTTSCHFQHYKQNDAEYAVVSKERKQQNMSTAL